MQILSKTNTSSLTLIIFSQKKKNLTSPLIFGSKRDHVSMVYQFNRNPERAPLSENIPIKELVSLL